MRRFRLVVELFFLEAARFFSETRGLGVLSASFRSAPFLLLFFCCNLSGMALFYASKRLKHHTAKTQQFFNWQAGLCVPISRYQNGYSKNCSTVPQNVSWLVTHQIYTLWHLIGGERNRPPWREFDFKWIRYPSLWVKISQRDLHIFWKGLQIWKADALGFHSVKFWAITHWL